MAYPGEQLGHVEVCEAEVFRHLNALTRRLQTRLWRVNVSDKSYRISQNLGNTVKLTFVRKFMNFHFKQSIICRIVYNVYGEVSTQGMLQVMSIFNPSDNSDDNNEDENVTDNHDSNEDDHNDDEDDSGDNNSDDDDNHDEMTVIMMMIMNIMMMTIKMTVMMIHPMMTMVMVIINMMMMTVMMMIIHPMIKKVMVIINMITVMMTMNMTDDRVPTAPGKPGKMTTVFPVLEKSWNFKILLKILEKWK